MSDLLGPLSVIGMSGCEKFTDSVEFYLKQFRDDANERLPGESGEDAKRGSFLVDADCPRFATGEAKALIHQTLRGHDVYIISDCFNYGVTYKMYGKEVPMSPDDHFQDLKRVIAAIGGKARRVSVIMPMLYEGRQHKRSARESLDCALALQELVSMGVSNIITFDAHDTRVQNAIPLAGFDSVRPTYQMLKALVRTVPELSLAHDDIMIISPDEGAMSRCMYYSSVLGIDLGMFYKRRDYSRVVDGKNPIEAHEYLGRDVNGKDVIVVDDMISSGESLIDVAHKLKLIGAKRIFAFVTFGLFTSGMEPFDIAYNNGLFDRIFTTNLTYHPAELLTRSWYTEVNMCKYVALIIDTLNHDSTISSLLNPIKRIDKLLENYAVNHSDIQLDIPHLDEKTSDTLSQAV